MYTFIFFTLFIISYVSVRKSVDALQDFSICHNDFKLKPPDGLLPKNTFGWLGFVQYVHVTMKIRHHTKLPRVVLIHRQFVMGTAKDLLRLPNNYKLDNVIFGEYEREEAECGLSHSELKDGVGCPYAYLESPLLEITPHPEYSRFGVGNSLAVAKLLRPIKSRYMMPICLPSIEERTKKKNNKFVFMVDYISSAPRDLSLERMGKKTLKLYTHKECRAHRMRKGLGSEGVTHVLCSTGCGARPGAPIASQNADGGFELIGITAGSGPCTRRGMRRRLIREPPLYIDVYPYTTWIINVVTAFELPRAYPLNFRKSAGGTNMAIHKDFTRARKAQAEGWSGHIYSVGNLCFKKKRRFRKAAFFYSENFYAHADRPSEATVIMQLSAGIDCTIVCARLRLPSRLTQPTIKGVGGYNITLLFDAKNLPKTYYYALGLYGKNTTQRDLALWLDERNPDW